MAIFRKELLLFYGAIYLCCIPQLQGVLVGESDLTVQEGSSRQVFVRRSGTQPVNISIFATTIEGYRHLQQTSSGHMCSVTLTSLIRVNESEVDPAKANDLLVREYTLTYGIEEQERSLLLEVADDNIAESEEVFILYTNFMETLNDRCATPVHLQDNDVVQFNFSTANLFIRENEDLPSQLSIVKTGQIDSSISFQVYVYPVEGNPNENDFIANSDHLYVFTNETRELPIATQLVDDLMAEYNELVIICLPSLHEYMMAEAVDPNCVRVTINDDDSVVIGFSNSNTSLVLTEGGSSETICIDIKQGGFPLHPNSHLELTLQTESIDEEVEYGDERLEFNSTQMTSCKTITARDDHVSDGSPTSTLTIGMAFWSSVPVVMSPGRIPITIIDNDLTTFELNLNTNANRGGSQAPPNVQEGITAYDLIKIQKTGFTTFAYSVVLSVNSLTESADLAGLSLNTNVRFRGSSNEVDVVDIPLHVQDDSIPERRKLFDVSIFTIYTFNTEASTPGSIRGAQTVIEGEPIRIIVYDNDFNIGFVNDSFYVPPDGNRSQNYDICVAILDPEPTEIDPVRRIPLLILTMDSDISRDILRLEMNEITLSATNNQVCIAAVISECENARNFTLKLHWNSNPLYKVNFQQQNITIKCEQGLATTEGCQSCTDEGELSPMNPTDQTIIIVCSVVIPITVVLVVITIIIVVIKMCEKKSKRNPIQRHNQYNISSIPTQ